MVIPQIEIVVSKEGVEVTRHALLPGEYIVGQDATADVVIDLPQVSKRHARLTIEDETIYVEDLGSEAGTFVNGLSVKDKTRVWPSQEIRLGAASVEAHLLIEPGVGAEPAPTDPAVVESNLLVEEVVVERKYEIEKILRREEEGAVLDTHDSAIRRDLAMKVMTPGGTEEEVARFVEEAQITGQLEHPAILPIHEMGTDEQGRLYFTMKVTRGMRLSKLLELVAAKQADALAKYSLHPLLGMFQKVCEAVAFAHCRGIIHRDLRPENIHVGDFGEVLVMDWGSAKRLDDKNADAATASSTPATCHPAYLSPEQARGETSTLDIRTDIYSLGAILYHLLSLRGPVLLEDRATALTLIGEGKTDRLDVGQRYPHLPRERVPDPLAAVVAKAMALKPADRYQKVEELQADLTAYQNLTITTAEKVGPIRQFFFVVRRYKTVFLAAAIVVGTSLFFGGAAILESLHAKSKEAKATNFVATIKGKAPALVQLAQSEADAQNFDNAIAHLDAALALEPAQPRAYWERAWALLGLERWDDAAAALKVAQQHDSAGPNLTAVYASIDKMKTSLADPQRWRSDAGRELQTYLQTAGSTGPALAIADKIQASAEVRRKLIDQRLFTSLGRDHYQLTVDREGMIVLSLTNQALRTLDPIRGLPIDVLDLSDTPILDVEQLRPMRLQGLILSNTKVASIAPLQRMPLRKLVLDGTLVDNLSPLQGAAIKELDVRHCAKLRDFGPVLSLSKLEKLSCDVLPEQLAGLKQSATMQTIDADAYPGENHSGPRAAAIFWTEYEARKGSKSQK